MFKNMRIGLRLGLGFGVSIVLMLILGVMAINRLASLDVEMDHIVHGVWPKTVMANDMIDHINIVARSPAQRHPPGQSRGGQARVSPGR